MSIKKYKIVNASKISGAFGILKTKITFRSLLDETLIAMLFEGPAAEALNKIRKGSDVALYFSDNQILKKMVVL